MKKTIKCSLLILLLALGFFVQSPLLFAQANQVGGTVDLSNSRICPKCGAINLRDNRFCKDCGYNFAAAMQGQTQPKGPKKEPMVAWALSFFLLPGLGQFYNGDGGKGAAQLLLYSGATTTWVLSWPSTEQHYYGYGYGYTTESGNSALFWTGMGIAGVTWIWSWIDAPMSAGNKNKANGYTCRGTPQLNFTLTPDPKIPQKLNIGLVLRKSF